MSNKMGTCFSYNQEYMHVPNNMIEDDDILSPPPSAYPVHCSSSPESNESVEFVEVAELQDLPKPPMRTWRPKSFLFRRR